MELQVITSGPSSFFWVTGCKKKEVSHVGLQRLFWFRLLEGNPFENLVSKLQSACWGTMIAAPHVLSAFVSDKAGMIELQWVGVGTESTVTFIMFLQGLLWHTNYLHLGEKE